MSDFISQREARGVPLVGGRRSSAIPGTDPLPAVISKEQRGRLKPPVSLDPIPRGIISVRYDRKGPPLVTRGARESGRFFIGR